MYLLSMYQRDGRNTDFTVKNCLFGDVKITKNAYPDKYSYLRYGIGLILVHFFNLQTLIGLKMSFFYWTHLWILTIKIKISKFLI